MPSLDAYTLVVVSALSAFFMAVTMVGIYLAGNREAAILDWALAGFLFCLGYALGSLILSGAALFEGPFVLASFNAIIAFGYGLVLLGVQKHLKYPRWIVVVVLVPVGVVLSIVYVPSMYDNTALRVGVLTVVDAGLSIIAAGLLWRAVDRPLMAYRRAVAIVLTANAMVLVIRALYVMLGADGPVAPNSPSVLVPVFLSAVLFLMALNVSLALMLFRRKEVHLRFMARHDALTGLLNRYSLDEYAAREIARADRGHQNLSLVVLDLDNFKRVNDRYGHAAGDQVLVQAAQRIYEVIREGDIAFRVGGEEFLVLLPGADREVAGRVAERLRAVLVDQPFECPEQSVTVSTSVGVVTFDPSREDWESLLRRADRALYRAKDGGRNRVEVAGSLRPARDAT